MVTLDLHMCLEAAWCSHVTSKATVTATLFFVLTKCLAFILRQDHLCVVPLLSAVLVF